MDAVRQAASTISFAQRYPVKPPRERERSVAIRRFRKLVPIQRIVWTGLK
jgi:hypothetical protein